MFSFTKVETWRTVNFMPKCTRLHQIASQISTPLPKPLPRLGHSIIPLTVSYPPETNGWVKPWFHYKYKKPSCR